MSLRTSTRTRKARSSFVAGPSKRVRLAESDLMGVTKRVQRSRNKRKTFKRSQAGDVLSALQDADASVTQLVRDLLDEDKSELCKKLLEFVLESSGSSLASISDFFTDNVSILELDDKTMDVMDDFCKEVAGREDCFVGEYTLKGGEGWEGFEETLDSFWKQLVAEGGTSFALADDGDFMTDLLVNLEKISTAPLGSFRHVAMFCAASLACGLIELVHTQMGKLEKGLKQLETKGKGKTDVLRVCKELSKTLMSCCAPGSTEKDPETLLEEVSSNWGSKVPDSEQVVIDLGKNCISFAQSIVELNGFILDTFKKISIRRCADIHEPTCLKAVQSIGVFMKLDPLTFMPLGKIYVQKLMSRPEAEIRTQAFVSFQWCMDAKVPKNESENRRALEQKTKWADHAKGTLLESLNDESPLVVAAGIGALGSLHTIDASRVDLGDERRVIRCLCYEDEGKVSFSNVRRAAAKFTLKVHHGLLDENLDDGKASSNARARLKLSSFVDLLGILVENRTGDDDDEEGDEQKAVENICLTPSLMQLVIDAFWDLSHCQFLRNWETMCTMLQSYGENEVTGELGQYKARVVAGILSAAADRTNRLSADEAFGLSKKEKKALENEYDDMKASLHNTLTQWLGDCLTTFRSDEDVLRSLMSLVENFDPSKCIKDSDRRGLTNLTKALSGIVSQHSDPSILLSTCETFANHFVFTEDDYILRKEAHTEWRKLTEAVIKQLKSNMNKFLKEKIDPENLVRLENSFKRLGMILRVAKHDSAPLRLTIVKEVEKVIEQVAASSYSEHKERIEGIVTEGLLLLQIDFTWSFDAAAESVVEVEAASDDDENREPEAMPQAVQDARQRRDILQSLVETIMSTKSVVYKRAALAVYNDLRVLCTRELDTQGTVLYQLAWAPSTGLQEHVTTFTMKLLKEAVSKGEDGEYDTILVRKEMSDIAVPCIRTLLSDSKADSVSNTVGSYIMQHFDSAEDHPLHEMATLLNHELKRSNPAQFIELQLTTLRNLYATHHDNLKKLSSALAKSVPGTQSKVPEKYGPAIVGMVSEGVKFSMQQAENVGFLLVLVPYIKLLRVVHKKQVQALWVKKMESIPTTVSDAIFKGTGDERQAFKAFEVLLGVSSIVPGTPASKPTENSLNDSISESGSSTRSSSRQRKKRAMQSAKAETSSTPERSTKKQRTVSTPDSTKEIEKNLFDSDSESVKERLIAKSFIKSGDDSKDVADDPLFEDNIAPTETKENAPATETKPDDNDTEIGFGGTRRRRR
mmetsp:Transcript_11713/g.21351  ORF Transcript_11713/g.21351 Transcript_11713/m.21351 type:complete len:1264 (+) Transcript_11713:118-3909(+)|eukprot:CAMPEP_0203755142 /NCGR_PEP_ID=MMETSP0098-20131031/8639_1 /ASSEMBLY_ACC=CAM_ASM_000208 /TAXON_ID=96639 /ORGANISM=" , Strain NY0313808BC1" /LENGTH=1263 /DNA_ID=CAMNT_0050646479 /DNA_START=89 /DNA_END=3880 /DNA_ORIENTATION=-